MKANPGGQLPLECIVGRDELTRDLWATLDQQSVHMTAERRIGKTQILCKMEQEHPPGWVPIRRDLEAIHSVREFAEEVYQSASGHFSKTRKTLKLAGDLLARIHEIGSVKWSSSEAPWKSLLRVTIEDLISQQGDTRLVFLWDEMPYMLANIARSDGEATAREVLDVLRQLRQAHPAFRMVLTGSIGFHHILKSLKQSGGSSSPLNDMATVEVPPLPEAAACDLVQMLIRGENLECAEPEAAARELVSRTDCFAYYIHRIIKDLKLSGQVVSVKNIQAAIENLVTNPNDPCGFRHYASRIHSYYPEDQDLTLAVLDSLAGSRKSLTRKEVAQLVKNQLVDFSDDNYLHGLLNLLISDHYLTRTRNGKYGFKFPLIQKWWCFERGLN